jgi:hypothetical protein
MHAQQKASDNAQVDPPMELPLYADPVMTAAAMRKIMATIDTTTLITTLIFDQTNTRTANPANNPKGFHHEEG